MFFFNKAQPKLEPAGELKLVQITPPSGKTKILHLTTGIQFKFDSPIIISTADVSVDPFIQLSVDTAKGDSNTLVVGPKTPWQPNTKYLIVLKNGLKSINNKELKEDLSYEIEFEIPSNIESY